MEINSFRGASVYGTAPYSAPTEEAGRLRKPDMETPGIEQREQNSGNPQPAFEVTLSRESRDMIAQETTEPPPAPENPPPADANAPANAAMAYEKSRIVNIVA